MTLPVSFSSMPGSNGVASKTDPITVLIAGPVQRLTPWMSQLVSDGRFSVISIANELPDLRAKLAANPEVLLLDATILGDEQTLTTFLTGLACAAYVITPVQGGTDLPGRVAQIQSVKAAFFADVNLSELVGRMYADALALRVRKAGSLEAVWNQHQGGMLGGGPIGLRIICVWNQMGGVGKTTVATNLAYESARRGFPTLLVGLGAPDDLPLISGLKPEPNITQWWNNPTPEGIKLAIQKLDTLDVLPGFPDVLSEAQAINTPREAPNSIPNLITKAAHYAGYAVIVIDAPPSALAATAISVSNTLVMVARPSLEGVMRTVEAYRTVVERLEGEHRIPNDRVFVVLNRIGNRLAAEEWHRAATSSLGRPFPPIIAQIPDTPAVGNSQDSRRLPIVTVEEFSRTLRPLADTLLIQPGQSSQIVKPSANGKKSLNIGGIQVKF